MAFVVPIREIESTAVLYKDGNYEGGTFDCFDVAGGSENWQAFGFRDKNRDILAQALLSLIT